MGRDVLERGASMLPPVVLDMALHWRSVRAGTGAVPERGPEAEVRAGGVQVGSKIEDPNCYDFAVPRLPTRFAADFSSVPVQK